MSDWFDNRQLKNLFTLQKELFKTVVRKYRYSKIKKETVGILSAFDHKICIHDFFSNQRNVIIF